MRNQRSEDTLWKVITIPIMVIVALLTIPITCSAERGKWLSSEYYDLDYYIINDFLVEDYGVDESEAEEIRIRWHDVQTNIIATYGQLYEAQDAVRETAKKEAEIIQRIINKLEFKLSKIKEEISIFWHDHWTMPTPFSNKVRSEDILPLYGPEDIQSLFGSEVK